MGELAFILVTIFFVILIFLIVNRIIVRYNREKKVVPHEDFNGELNNLDKIIEGVSMKDEIEEEIEEEEQIDEDNEDIEVDSKKKRRTKRNKNNSLKNAMITKEILSPKHNKLD